MKWQVFIIISLVVLQGIVLGGIVFLMQNPDYLSRSVYANTTETTMLEDALEPTNIYKVYVNQILVEEFDLFEDALQFATEHDNSGIIYSGEIIWENQNVFYVIKDTKILSISENFADAVNFARHYSDSAVYFGETRVWQFDADLRSEVRLNVPLIKQLPELARGCEVTSLAMLLNYIGVDVDKMTLAEQITKSDVPIHYVDGRKYSGDPNEGFIGNIYTFNEDGLGVYHAPIHALMKSYVGKSAVDLTGSEFEDLFYILNQDLPIWVITNSRHRELEDSQFQTWFLTNGEPLRVTYRLHSVVITGYSETHIYGNDPLTGHIRIPRDDFRAAWEQMGRQAVAYVPRYN